MVLNLNKSIIIETLHIIDNILTSTIKNNILENLTEIQILKDKLQLNILKNKKGQEVNLDRKDLVFYCNIIKSINKKGLFETFELEIIGKIYNNLNIIIKYIDKNQTKIFLNSQDKKISRFIYSEDYEYIVFQSQSNFIPGKKIKLRHNNRYIFLEIPENYSKGKDITVCITKKQKLSTILEDKEYLV